MQILDQIQPPLDHNMLEKDSLKFQSIITNSENLGKQLYQLWLQLNSLMQKYDPPFPAVQISHIHTFIENIMIFVITILFNALFIQ